jgi:hypothetical protein
MKSLYEDLRMITQILFIEYSYTTSSQYSPGCAE